MIYVASSGATNAVLQWLPHIMSSRCKRYIWTDGASPNNQDARFSRAGSGIYYGSMHSMNLHVFVPGLVQSNQRAELLAVVLACLRDPRPLDIRTDSDYVCKGFASWRSWSVSEWHGDHADLWNLLASDLRVRSSAVQVSWVKGHAKQLDIDRGRTTKEDKMGNDEADALAVAGAKLHAVPSEVLEAAKTRKESGIRVQQMMVTVLKARLTIENASHIDADRGSELGEGTSTLDVDACMSDTEPLHASGTEPATACACDASLNDECDEDAVTYFGAVQ